MSFVITALVDNVPELIAEASSIEEAVELLNAGDAEARFVQNACDIARNRYWSTPMRQHLRPVPFTIDDRKLWVVVR